jgi:hypothetical protein
MRNSLRDNSLNARQCHSAKVLFQPFRSLSETDANAALAFPVWPLAIRIPSGDQESMISDCRLMMIEWEQNRKRKLPTLGHD